MISRAQERETLIISTGLIHGATKLSFTSSDNLFYPPFKPSSFSDTKKLALHFLHFIIVTLSRVSPFVHFIYEVAHMGFATSHRNQTYHSSFTFFTHEAPISSLYQHLMLITQCLTSNTKCPLPGPLSATAILCKPKSMSQRKVITSVSRGRGKTGRL